MKNKKNLLITIIIFVLLIGAIIGGWMYYKKRNAAETAKSTNGGLPVVNVTIAGTKESYQIPWLVANPKLTPANYGPQNQ